ncbi:hypothetical protein MTBPR1_40216 [Candidatus Terasakiella magnetica]|uniref:Uncharacterized protein n=1 Tax=Candidatus Terasakiella magnetica TaxID=1867952 RepID=A0A1C3RIU9_9PROT|nr:hypothetical protein [Candidatus Terasakiella magnetica]SCA57193.1 hypothetical protein MTBPR1_40216 [Candidatus Terasakiella magnetica]
MSTDKHLIAEIKHELDWAAEEVKRTETEVMKLEVDFNKSMEGQDDAEIKRLTEEKEHLQERIGLHDAYSLQRRAASRFAMLCHVFDIASMGNTSDTLCEQLSRFLFRSVDGEAENKDQHEKLLELAEALIAYFADGHSDEADHAIRSAWQDLEEMLRAIGRKI